MKTIRLFIRLSGILLIILGFNSCKKDKDDVKKKCNGEEFTCTYSYNDGTTYSYRYCEDGWYAYYANGNLVDVYYNSVYTNYWNEYKQEWMDIDASDNDLNCVF